MFSKSDHEEEEGVNNSQNFDQVVYGWPRMQKLKIFAFFIDHTVWDGFDFSGIVHVKVGFILYQKIKAWPNNLGIVGPWQRIIESLLLKSKN